MSTLLDKLLNHYNIDIEGYKALIAEPSFSSIPLLDINDKEVSKAKERVFKAVRTHEKVIIYGDYDCDGIMSTSILAKALKKLGLTPATYIPSRYVDGYGINKENAKRIALAGYSLVILVDNGITAYEGIDELKKNNIDVLIIDHHQLGSTLPEVNAILHPSLLNYGFFPISAGYLSFLFSIVLLNDRDDYLLSLGALSTLSDMMPLRGHNREIVRLALNIINKKKYPNFICLTETYQNTVSSLSLEMIPCINAIGRMVEDTTINRLVSYFIEEDPKKVEQLSKWMKSINAERKDNTKTSFDSLNLSEESNSIVVVSEGKEGINGLLANILLQRFNKPTIVFSTSSKDPNVLIGSGRSKEGMSLIEMYQELASYFVTCGGHELAGGLSIKKEDFLSFKKAFDKYAFNHPFIVKKVNSIELEISEINKENFDLIQSFGPFGMDWEEVKIAVKNVQTEGLTFAKDGKYLCHKAGPETKLFSFEISRDKIEGHSFINLIGTLRSNIWKNIETIEYICSLDI